MRLSTNVRPILALKSDYRIHITLGGTQFVESKRSSVVTVVVGGSAFVWCGSGAFELSTVRSFAYGIPFSSHGCTPHTLKPLFRWDDISVICRASAKIGAKSYFFILTSFFRIRHSKITFLQVNFKGRMTATSSGCKMCEAFG